MLVPPSLRRTARPAEPPASFLVEGGGRGWGEGRRAPGGLPLMLPASPRALLHVGLGLGGGLLWERGSSNPSLSVWDDEQGWGQDCSQVLCTVSAGHPVLRSGPPGGSQDSGPAGTGAVTFSSSPHIRRRDSCSMGWGVTRPRRGLAPPQPQRPRALVLLLSIWGWLQGGMPGGPATAAPLGGLGAGVFRPARVRPCLQDVLQSCVSSGSTGYPA